MVLCKSQRLLLANCCLLGTITFLSTGSPRNLTEAIYGTPCCCKYRFKGMPATSSMLTLSPSQVLKHAKPI